MPTDQKLKTGTLNTPSSGGIAILSDIHANIDALGAVLADLADQRCFSIFCLGDTIGYGPDQPRA
jgi:predicted phosphodiesterase